MLFPLALVTSITLTGILIYVSLVLFVILFFLREKKIDSSEDLNLIVKAFLIYIFAFTISKLINSGCGEALKAFLKTLQDLFIFLWAFKFVLDNEKNKKIFKYGLFIAAIITLGYGIMQFFHLDLFHRQENLNRISGFHKNTYSYAGQLIVFFFFLFFEFKNHKNKLLVFLIPALSFFCILNASERAVILGVSISILIYIFLSTAKKEDIMKIFFIVSVPVLITTFLHDYVVKRLNNTFSSAKAIKGNVRFKIWKSALAVWKKNIFFGVGKFPTFVYKPVGSLKIQYLTHAHNVYLQILVANGLIGLIAFFNLFYSFTRVLLKHFNKNGYALCLLLVIIAFSIEGFFEFFYGDSEVRYLLIYFSGYIFGNLIISDQSTKS